MLTQDPKDKSLLAQSDALGIYIDTLLTPATKTVDQDQWTALVKVLKNMDVGMQNTDIEILPLTPTTQENTVSVLTCRVGRLDVGIPIEMVERVIACPPYIAEELRQSDEKILVDDGEYKRIIALHNVVFPLPHLARMKRNDESEQRLIVLKRDGCALVCDSVGDVKHLADEDITWRSEKTARKWLLGTSLSQSIALIDIEALLKDL